MDPGRLSCHVLPFFSAVPKPLRPYDSPCQSRYFRECYATHASKASRSCESFGGTNKPSLRARYPMRPSTLFLPPVSEDGRPHPASSLHPATKKHHSRMILSRRNRYDQGSFRTPRTTIKALFRFTIRASVHAPMLATLNNVSSDTAFAFAFAPCSRPRTKARSTTPCQKTRPSIAARC